MYNPLICWMISFVGLCLTAEIELHIVVYRPCVELYREVDQEHRPPRGILRGTAGVAEGR